MTILGIDPGLERVGWGIVEKNGSVLRVVAHGLVTTPRIEIGARLALIHQEVSDLLSEHGPQAVATERLFFAKNQTTAIDVAKALGVVVLACAGQGLVCHEYSPPEVKLAVVGNGAAEKRQVQFMVTKLLGLNETPKPDDVADALAVAVTHALRSGVPAAKV